MSTDTTVARLAERHLTQDAIVQALTTRPPSYCPTHRDRLLEGGPVLWRCPLDHSVPATDINREVT